MATVRRLTLGAALACAATFGTARAAQPVATFSIVGYDPETKELGVCVQSGSEVPGADVEGETLRAPPKITPRVAAVLQESDAASPRARS